MNTFITAAFAFGLAACTACNSGPGTRDALRKDIPQLMAKTNVPGLVVAKVEDGEIAWSEAFGERSSGESMTTATVFNAASLTKPMFATMMLHLVADDELSLDEPVSRSWVDPDVVNDPRHDQLTPRILLSHQSGFPNWRGNGELQFMFEPGTRHEYSGEGYEYLRRAVERKTGSTLSEIANEQVLEPLALENTSFGWSDRFAGNVVTGYNEAGEPIDTGIPERGPNAAANLMTTATDYARFAAWVGDGADLPDPLFTEMRKPQAMHAKPAERFGLGWKLIPLGGTNALMHDGREPGVRTFAIVLPETDEALVIFTNSSNGELLFRPLVRAALPVGDKILASMDRLVWTYLERLPPPALVPMSRGIARSPTYLSTLLHAVDVALIQPSGLSAAEKASARKAIDPYVYALFNGEIESAQVEKLIERLLIDDGETLALRDRFNTDAARAWLAALQDTK